MPAKTLDLAKGNRRKFRSQTSDYIYIHIYIWTDEKAEVGRVREENRRRKKIREEKKAEDRRCRGVKR